MIFTIMNRDKERIDEILKVIGAEIARLRREMGYPSHEKFSAPNDMSRSSYESYEHGGNMNLATFIHILGVMGVSFQDFFADLGDLTSELYPDRLTKEEILKIWPPKS